MIVLWCSSYFSGTKKGKKIVTDQFLKKVQSEWRLSCVRWCMPIGAFFPHTGWNNLVGTERSHGNKVNKLLTYEAENCRPFYMQTLPASEGTSWNKNETTNEQQKLVIQGLILYRFFLKQSLWKWNWQLNICTSFNLGHLTNPQKVLETSLRSWDSEGWPQLKSILNEVVMENLHAGFWQMTGEAW